MLVSPLTRFTAASGLTNLGDGIATIAWAWTASLITRDPLLVALVAIALRLPWAVFALPAGVVADRVDRRKLILMMDIVRSLAFAAALVALLLAMPLPEAPAEGVSSLPAFLALLIAAVVVGAAEVFRDNAAQTMLPALVPHEKLEKANGRLWSIEIAGNALVGPPLGALLVAAFLPLPFAANAGAYAIAALVVAGLAGNFRPKADAGAQERNWRRELAEGLAFLRDAPLLRTLARLTGLWNLFCQMALIALILHGQENLGLTSTAYGLILAAGAVGGIAGGLMGERIVRFLGPARTTQITLLWSAPSFIGLALAPDAVSLGIIMFLFEFAGLVWNTVTVATRQRMIPDRLLGRVNSAYRLLAWGMIPLGLALSGLIVRLADGPLPRDVALTLPFWLAAAGVLVTSAFGWRPLARGLAPAGRRERQAEPAREPEPRPVPEPLSEPVPEPTEAGASASP